MGAREHLSNYGVTIEVAKDFIIDNIQNLSYIYDTCARYGVTNDMVAEILDTAYPGLQGVDVANYFASNGIDSDGLGGSSRTIDIVNGTGNTGSSGSSTSTNIPESGGDLNLSTMKDDYTVAYMYENISLDAINAFLTEDHYNHYKYAEASTWTETAGFGYEHNYADSETNGYVHDSGSANNYTNNISHFDLTDYSEADSLDLIQLQGFAGNDYNGNAIGNYDLVFGWY